MNSAEWWAGLLQGSLGAAIGLVGLFGVFWLTRRHEMSRDAVARQENEALVARQRTEVGVVKIVEAAHTLRFGSESNTDDQLERLCHRLTLFSVKEAADHPAAAKWAVSQSSKVLDLAGPTADIRAAPWQGAYITAVLTQWVQQRFPEDFFSKAAVTNDRQPERQDNITNAVLAELDRSGKPASIDNLHEVFIAMRRRMPQSKDESVEQPSDRQPGEPESGIA